MPITSVYSYPVSRGRRFFSLIRSTIYSRGIRRNKIQRRIFSPCHFRASERARYAVLFAGRDNFIAINLMNIARGNMQSGDIDRFLLSV